MRRLAAAISLTALTTLVLELVLTRVFDVVLTPNMAYMVITCAIFAFGLAGLYASIWPLADRSDPDRLLGVLATLLAVSTVALLPVLNILPFDFDRIGEEPLKQVAAFGAMYLALVVPFFLSGLILTTAFSRHPKEIQRLYAWDLAGAAVGCVLLIPFLPAVGAGGLLLISAALALFASALFSARRGWSLASVGLAVVLVGAAYALPPRALEFREHVNKRGVKEAQEKGIIEFTRWDPISKIDVIPMHQEIGRLGDSVLWSNAGWHIAYDGGQQSSNYFRFDGNLARLRADLDANVPGTVLRNFWQRGVLASHYLKRDRGQKVLIFGSAGGQETKAALVYGASRVDAIELVRIVVELGQTRYAQAIGNIFNRPEVHVQVGEGRSFLRASGDRYDIIQIFSNFTSSSIANGSAALSPNYLQTAEAYREYFEHLTPDGILHINHLAYPRMVSTAALAWHQLGRDDFRRHVLVAERSDAPDDLPTLLIKMTPWTAAEVADIKAFFAADVALEGPRHLAENPVAPERGFLSNDFYSGVFPEQLNRRLNYHAAPATDDKPFFFLLRKRFAKLKPDAANFLNPSIAGMLNLQLKRGRLPLDLMHLLVVGVVSLLFSIIAIAVPLRYARVGRQAWPGKVETMVYFACLGAGFITLELVLIQVFMKLIGYPLYTYSTVIFTLLLAAGTGSRLSSALGIGPNRRWAWPFIGILVTGALFVLVHASFFRLFLAAPLPARVLLGGALIFPLGLFLGMPFPLGILSVEGQPSGAVAWAWGLNGIFTVVGGLASVLCSMMWGFQLTIVAALLVYALAFATFARIRAAGAAREPRPALESVNAVA